MPRLIPRVDSGSEGVFADCCPKTGDSLYRAQCHRTDFTPLRADNQLWQGSLAVASIRAGSRASIRARSLR